MYSFRHEAACCRITLKADVGRSIRFVFQGDFGFDQPGIYEPVITEITSEEMEELLNSLAVTNKLRDDLFRLLSGIDFNDNRQMNRAAQEYFRRASMDIDHPIMLTPPARWMKMLAAAQKIPLTGRYVRSIDNPDYDFPGNIQFEFGVSYGNPIIIDENIIPDVMYLIQLSDEVDIEGNVNTGDYGIGFMA